MSSAQIPVSFKPYQIKIFDRNGRSVYTEGCGFKPDLDYVQKIIPFVFVKLMRRGKKDVKDYTVAIVESTVTVLGSVNKVLGEAVK